MGDLQIEKGSGAKPNVTFYSDGVATDLDGACTATVVKPDGTQIVGSPFTASHVAPTGSGKYEFTLASQPELIYYDVTWAGAIGGVATSVATRVEVVGVFLYTLAAMRAVKVAGSQPFNVTDFPNQMLLDRRAEVTDDFEQRTGWSFIPRFTRETHDGTGTSTLELDEFKASRLLSVTINGAAQAVGNYTLDPTLGGRATTSFALGVTFPVGVGNIVVEYVRGWDRPPPAVSSAGLARTAMLLLPSQAGSTVSSWTTPDGTTYSYDQAGQNFGGGGTRHYGVPGIDSTLNDASYKVSGGVFA